MIAGLGLFAKTAGLSRPARATCLHSVGALAGITKFAYTFEKCKVLSIYPKYTAKNTAKIIYT